MKNILNALLNNLKEMVDMIKGLPLVIAIVVIIAIILLPDPLVMLGFSMVKKFKLMV